MRGQADHAKILETKLSCVGVPKATEYIIKYNKLCVGLTHVEIAEVAGVRPTLIIQL